jgi:hypothetical protein
VHHGRWEAQPGVSRSTELEVSCLADYRIMRGVQVPGSGPLVDFCYLAARWPFRGYHPILVADPPSFLEQLSSPLPSSHSSVQHSVLVFVRSAAP